MLDKESSEKGQVGIGTLIVFIAMVLVAAIAAGVLINTAGMLQSQAEATGEESTDLVSERIDVTTSVGTVATGASELEEIRIGVTGAPGSDDIDLSETIIQVVGPGGQENLVMTGPGGDGMSDDDDTATSINSGYFAVSDTDGSFIGADSAVIDEDNGDYSIVLNPQSEPLADTEANFGEGHEATLDIVSPSGATTQVELRAPDLFNSENEAVRL